MRFTVTTLILCVGSLLAIGMITLYSSSNAQFGTKYLALQAAWTGAGVVACVAAASIDYRWLKKFAWLPYALAIITLALVLIPSIGLYRNGSRRWLPLGFASFQPSEAGKLALIILLAWYGDRFQPKMRTFWRGLVLPGALAGVMLALVFLEPDRGTTILLGALTMVMLLLAGARWFYIIPPAVAGAAAMVYVLMADPVRMSRINSWLHPEDHKSGTGYQSWQALIALGAGGPAGLGLGNGRQKLGFLPEYHTDFIFSILGEEFGLVGTLGVLAVFLVFVLCGVYVAWHARDAFGLLLAGGVTFLIGMQAFINIGVVTSALPNKGLPLPFISYGGSSLLLMLLAVGLLLSVARLSLAAGSEETEVQGFRNAQFA